MLAFAANSVLCRLALAGQHIDPMSFSLIRVSSGAFVLMLLYLGLQQKSPIPWNIKNAVFLAIYMVCFSLAYLHIDAGIGALLLFGVVQLSMVIYGILHDEQLNFRRGFGIVLALLGIIILLLPGAGAPHLGYASLMVISGLGWAGYSIVAKKTSNPFSGTLANFVLAIPMVLAVMLILQQPIQIDMQGVILAGLSGGFASSGAYVLWYVILKQIDRVTASTVQLSVPCLAIVGGGLFIGESIGLRTIVATLVVLCGIGLVIFAQVRQT